MDAVRAPAVSGRFYPGTQAQLERAVRSLLDAVPAAVPAPARAAMVPHAGYAYSGLTAAHVFARLEIPPLVIVLAPNHTGVCRAPGGASLWEAGAFRTPLGETAVDDRFAGQFEERWMWIEVEYPREEIHRRNRRSAVKIALAAALAAGIAIGFFVPLHV